MDPLSLVLVNCSGICGLRQFVGHKFDVKLPVSVGEKIDSWRRKKFRSS